MRPFCAALNSTAESAGRWPVIDSRLPCRLAQRTEDSTQVTFLANDDHPHPMGGVSHPPPANDVRTLPSTLTAPDEDLVTHDVNDFVNHLRHPAPSVARARNF